jgi:hypothetical protein
MNSSINFRLFNSLYIINYLQKICRNFWNNLCKAEKNFYKDNKKFKLNSMKN